MWLMRNHLVLPGVMRTRVRVAHRRATVRALGHTASLRTVRDLDGSKISSEDYRLFGGECRFTSECPYSSRARNVLTATPRSVDGNSSSSRRLVSGRVREFGALQAERQRSALGELRVALVLGDAGLGKTRLAAELLPRDDELAVGLIAHSSPLGGMPLFGPWAGALGLHADAVDADGVCHACGSGLGGLPALIRRAEIAHDALSCVEAFHCHFMEWIPDLLAKASAD